MSRPDWRQSGCPAGPKLQLYRRLLVPLPPAVSLSRQNPPQRVPHCSISIQYVSGVALGFEKHEGNTRCKGPLDSVRVACRRTRQCAFHISHPQPPNQTLTALTSIKYNVEKLYREVCSLHLWSFIHPAAARNLERLRLFCSVEARSNHRRQHCSAESWRVAQICPGAALSWVRSTHTVRVAHTELDFLVCHLKVYMIPDSEVKGRPHRKGLTLRALLSPIQHVTPAQV